MQRILQDKYDIKLYSYKFSDAYDKYVKRPDFKYNQRRKQYWLPIVDMVASKLTSTIINSDVQTESKEYKFKNVKTLTKQYFKAGISLMGWSSEFGLINFEYDKILLGENMVIGWVNRMDGKTLVMVNKQDGVDWLLYDEKKNLIDERTERVNSKQFILLNDTPIWYENREQTEAIQIAWNNYVRDMVLGGKKVFMDKALLTIDPNTRQPIAPDDVAQDLFTLVEADMREKADRLFYEYNPSLRVVENTNSLAFNVGLFTSSLGLGNNFLLENRTNATHNSVIAWSTSNQELVDTVATFVMELKDVFDEFFSNIEGKNITFVFNTDFIIDRQKERENDRTDVQMGIMSKDEYRVRWYGESPEDAKKNVPVMDIFGA